MRMMLMAAAVGALGAATLAATPAEAQWRSGGYYGNNQNYNGNQVRREYRECQRELRRADSRREYERELRECRREIARARYGNGNDWYGRSGYYNRAGYRDDYRYRRY